MQSYFNKIINDPDDSLIFEAKNSGQIPIGYTCSYIPEVLLSVDRLLPIRMRATGITSTEMADTYLSLVLCTYSRTLLECAMEGRYDYLEGWVFASSCDHMCRLCDNLNYLVKPSFNHIVDLPRIQSKEALLKYIRELQVLAGRLSSHFGIDMGDNALSEAIKRYNELIKLIISIGESRKECNPLTTGTEFHRLITAYLTSPRNMIVESIKEYHKSIKDRNGINNYRARLMITGGELDNPEYTEIIESVGGLVVADRYCTGSLPGLKAIPEGNDPLETIAEHTFFTNVCPRMLQHFDKRLSYILQIVEEYKVDGIVIETIKFCDLWGIESMLLVSELRKAEVPVLRLEKEYNQIGEGQLRTRIQAFIESMGN